MPEIIHGLFEGCPNSLGDHLGICDEDAFRGFAFSGVLQASMISAAIIRLIQTMVTFGAMVPSGLFIPSLYVGSVLGRLVGLWCLHLDFFDNTGRKVPLNPGVCAMVGAISVLSGF